MNDETESSTVHVQVEATGESRERVDFRMPRELWNQVKAQVVLEKELARKEQHVSEPTTTDVINLLVKMGLAARQASLREKNEPSTLSASQFRT